MTLGQVLKARRTELGKSIEQIATATRIHVKVLNALENDQYAELPARAFTRGFIITYCKALQLNADEIMASYRDFLDSKFAERPEKDQGHHGYAFESKETEQKNRGNIIIAAIAAFFVILTLLFFKPQNHKHREKHKELIAEEADMVATEAALKAASDNTLQAESSPVANSTPTTNATPATIAATAAKPSPASSVAPLLARSPFLTNTPTPSPTPISKEDPMNKGDTISQEAAGVKVNFLATEDVIIRYRSDDRPMFGLNLRKDKQLVIKASEKIQFETSSPEKLKYKTTFKNKPTSPYKDLKEPRLELRSDGSQNPLKAWVN